MAVLVCAPSVTGQTIGFTTQPMVPVGRFAKAADIGWGLTAYVAKRLGRKSPFAIGLDVGVQWHAGDSIDRTEYPDVPPPDSEGDAAALSGWMFPLRAEITTLVSNGYITGRAGIYIPVADLDSKLGLEPSFGISPRVGYLFFVTRDLTADIGIEYTLVFDSDPIMYGGFGFGFLTGGKRLPRRRLPY